MFPDLRHKLVQPVAVLACLAISGLAVWEFLLTARYGVYSTLTSMIDSRQAISSGAIASYARKADQLPETCRTDLFNSAISVAMQDVEQVRNSGDQVAWIAGLRSLEPRLRQGLGCAPTDGLLWERLAVVRWFLGGSAQEQAHLMSMSQAYSPGELETLRVRVVQWTRVSPSVAEQAEDALRGDIRMTLRYAPLGALQAMLSNAPAFMTPIISDEARGLPVERAQALDKAKISLP